MQEKEVRGNITGRREQGQGKEETGNIWPQNGQLSVRPGKRNQITNFF
jgi:hypothetical protein